MSTVPYSHHEHRTLNHYLQPGQATPRSTSPRTSQIDLSNPDQDVDDVNTPGRLTRAPSVAESTRSRADDTLTPMDEAVAPDGDPRILPIAPTDVEKLKYHRFEYFSMDMKSAKVTHIEPTQRDYERDDIPAEWETRVCPEGKLYYVHKHKRVVTLTNIQHEEYYTRIMASIAMLYPRLEDMQIPDLELVVHCTWENGKTPVIGYYVADWEKHVVFWFDRVEHTLVTTNERPPASKPHLVWVRFPPVSSGIHFPYPRPSLHVEMFCAHRILPPSMVQEVKDSFNSGVVDVITSEMSMFSYDPDTTNHLVRVIDRMKGEGKTHSHTTWVVGRLFKTLHTDRFLAFYGESGARCSRNDNSMKDTDRNPRSWFFFLFSPFLFFMPFVYLKELDAVFVDKTVHYYAWRRFIGVLRKDWDNAITPATVLLSANVGFLAIQSIDDTGSEGNRSAAQIASYISAILSLFIYVVCQILTRRHRHYRDEQAERALDYLVSRQQRVMGLQTVAMAFSLPIALFIWSMLSFLAAMVFVFFDKTNMVTKITLGAILGVLVFLIVVLLYMEWDGGSPKSGIFIFRKDLRTYLHLKWMKRHRKQDPGVSSPEASAAQEDSDTSNDMSINFERASVTDVNSQPSMHDLNEKDNDVISSQTLSRSDTTDSSFKKRTWLSARWPRLGGGGRRGTMDSDETLHHV